MKKSIKKSKSPLKQNKIVDSVSASQLLQALHTLQHISYAEQQQSENLNISFSQKDNFNHTNQLSFQPSQSQSTIQTNHSKFNKTKIHDNKTQNENENHGSKMNFQFYMTKKQNKYKNKSTFQIINHKNTTQNVIQKSITPKKKPNQNKLQTHNKSISPLTQRSNNNISTINKSNNSIILSKQLQIKNTTMNPFKCMSKTPVKNTTIQVKNAKLQINKNKENYTQIETSHLTQRRVNKPKIPSSINELSIHQRNKQFLNKKNQRLAKLCQQIEEKKRQQEKQYTFKPKIISNNSHIKPKYNDLCASRQFYEKTHKRCKTGKQNLQNCFEDDSHSKGQGFKENKMNKNEFESTLQQQLRFESTAKLSSEQCDSRVKNSTQVYQKDEENKSIVKNKYKNSKFNILLDMIH